MHSSVTINLRADSSLYETFSYPAGETQLRLTATGLMMAKQADDINVIANIRNAQDVMSLHLLMNCLDEWSRASVNLILPYLPYARADRLFTPGDCHGLKAFSRVVNALMPASVITLDAHSRAAREYIGALTDVSPMPLIRSAITRFSALHGASSVQVLFPDQGAGERYQLPDSIGCNTNSITIDDLRCAKRRDPVSGKFLGFTVPERKSFSGCPVLVIDDICDGGGTFIGIAEALADYKLDLGLYVTHGIFSKGHAPLLAHFPKIYTTNTFEHPNTPESITVLDGISLLLAAASGSRIAGD